MKRKGTSIIFVNDQRKVLLLLRDDKPTIPYPNMWDVPGGHVDDGETPEQCIVREMKEEMDLTLEEFERLSVMEFTDRVEYTFWKRVNLDIEKIDLREGQRLRWFTELEARNSKLAYGFNEIIDDFFKKAPFFLTD
ncbi:MAG: NUDIX hydrolase [Deltaproteobacteria bacterium]|jgi:8-oxo-dGTP diphosphatase|nr:NUDIX hydrolase [Deltaproteobacteria bacterium]MBW1970782.1 NUDIX hydrolase [Deltaproteobacteria bacterium]MBW2157267.1 NUDIX hydrolase [Deltaproteobacteria bacterium]MBW2197793.1 NUDIX hydrolase [Deltaproteobacteria bacterium]MBW2227524.1 NUDIX hydrolase [Deltaproteobacteria bacterium]